jgi:hypothetical protein
VLYRYDLRYLKSGINGDGIFLTSRQFLFGYNSSTSTAAVTHRHNNGDNPAKPANPSSNPRDIAAKLKTTQAFNLPDIK